MAVPVVLPPYVPEFVARRDDAKARDGAQGHARRPQPNAVRTGRGAWAAPSPLRDGQGQSSVAADGDEREGRPAAQAGDWRLPERTRRAPSASQAAGLLITAPRSAGRRPVHGTSRRACMAKRFGEGAQVRPARRVRQAEWRAMRPKVPHPPALQLTHEFLAHLAGRRCRFHRAAETPDRCDVAHDPHPDARTMTALSDGPVATRPRGSSQSLRYAATELPSPCTAQWLRTARRHAAGAGRPSGCAARSASTRTFSMSWTLQRWASVSNWRCHRRRRCGPRAR